MNILIQNGTIITMHNKKIIRQGVIAIEDKNIIDIRKNQRARKWRKKQRSAF